MSYVIDASFIEIVKKLNVHWLLRIMIMRFRNFQKLIKHAFQANELSQCWQSLIWWIRARTRWTCWWGRSCRSSSELSESLIGLRLGIFIEIFSSKTFKILLFYLEKVCIIMDNFYLKMFVEMLFYRQKISNACFFWKIFDELRFQQAINDGKPIQEAIKDEQHFLQKKYPTLASRNGTPYLAKKLNMVSQFWIETAEIPLDSMPFLNSYEDFWNNITE